jgi:zinc protease
MMSGTKEKGLRQIHRQMELYGAEVEPVVDDDYFGVKICTLSRNVDGVLELLGDILQAPALSEEEITRQKELLQSQLVFSGEASREKADSIMLKSLFPDFPYSWSANQMRENLSRLDLPAVKDWYSRTVHNRKPIVVIIGDTQGTALAGFFVRRFSGTRFLDSKIPESFPKPVEAALQWEEKCEAGPDIVQIGFQAPPEGDEDSYPLEVLQNLMNGEGGRLTEQLRDLQGLAIDTFFQYQARAKGGRIIAGLYASPEKGGKAVESAKAELAKFIDSPLSYREFRAAVNGAVADYWYSQQNRDEQIMELARSLVAGHGLDTVLAHVARLQDVKQEDLPELARRLLNPGRSITVHLVGKH